MLTKKERAEIAERLKEYREKDLYPDLDLIYEALFNVSMSNRLIGCTDFVNLLNRLIKLCDTSNMMELPVDRDGEVIRIGDTVYDDDNVEYTVCKFLISKNFTDIFVSSNPDDFPVRRLPNELTHKKPVTVKSLAQRIRDILNTDDVETMEFASAELMRISRELDSLG